MPVTTSLDLRADSVRNRLELRFGGRVEAPDLRAAVPRIESALAELRPGFSVLTDLTALEAMALDCVDSLGQIMDRFRQHGVATVVRVIPDRDKDIGFNILSIIHLRRGVRVVTCTTLAEAEAALGG